VNCNELLHRLIGPIKEGKGNITIVMAIIIFFAYA